MEELLQTLLQLVYNDELPDMNQIQFTEDEDGIVTVKYQKPKFKKELQSFKDYVETLSDDIFETASARFRVSNPKEFLILSKDKIANVAEFNQAVAEFKKTVKIVVDEEIKDLEARIKALREQILKLQKFI